MNTPTWKLIVGGLAIYFGLWGTVSSVLSIAGTLSLSTQIKTEVMGEPNNGGISNHEPVEDPIRLFSEKPNWAIAMVMITLVVSVIYMVGGLALIKKPLGDRVFYLAIALSVLWGVAKTILFTQGHPQMLMAVLPTFAPSFIIDFVLAGIVFVKMRFPKNEEALTHQQEQSRQTYSSESPPSKVKIPMITGWFAVLCVAVFPVLDHGNPRSRQQLCPWLEDGITSPLGIPCDLAGRVWNPSISEKPNSCKSS